MAPVEYTGLKNFSDAQQAGIQTLSERYAKKFEKYYPDSVTRVILKANKRGNEGKQEVTATVRLDAPKTIAQAQNSEWEAEKAVHMTLMAVHNEIEKMADTNRKKTRVSVRTRK